MVAVDLKVPDPDIGQAGAIACPGGAQIVGDVNTVVVGQIERSAGAGTFHGDGVGGQIRQIAADIAPGDTAVDRAVEVSAREAIAHSVSDQAVGRIDGKLLNVVGQWRAAFIPI